VSGSFRRHMDAVQAAVHSLTDSGVEVLSPADPTVVDAFGDFLFVASDRLRTVRVVQSRHLAAIEASDFLWLVAPDGYVGPSAAMELGFAVAKEVPVFSVTPPQDLTMRQFVRVVPSMRDALATVRARPDTAKLRSGLVDPAAVIARAQDQLGLIDEILRTPDPIRRERMPILEEAATTVRQAVRGL
jgi:nucleoside 2-deoxyribosyltransferase